MLNLTVTPAASYAAQKNARFTNKASNILTIKDRWDTTFNSLPANRQSVVDLTLAHAIAEFRNRNPHLKTWQDVLDLLPETKFIPMSNSFIDATMQRLLKQLWSIEIVNNFMGLKVVPIQVYKPDSKKEQYVAWDGQHTLVALWLIATQIFGQDPKNVMIPVNVYKTNQKADMRDSFVGHNGGEYKEGLDWFDKIEQMIFGSRLDGSQNPAWHVIEQKQSIIEAYDLFLTKADFGDAHMPGAIGRMQEFMSLHQESLVHLCEYLVAVGCQTRPAQEKELVMMAYFFDRCRAESVKVTKQFIYDIAGVTKKYWKADFTPTSDFWNRCSVAYYTWHSQHVKGVIARFNKEPIHGYPFLVEQLKKDLPKYEFPSSATGSNFIPVIEDLYI